MISIPSLFRSFKLFGLASSLQAPVSHNIEDHLLLGIMSRIRVFSTLYFQYDQTLTDTLDLIHRIAHGV